MQALLDGIKKVKEGDNICIFPEGTRTDGPMLEFKGGSFKLATKSGAPILPLTIDGTHRVLEDNHFWIKNDTINLIYHPVIETKGMSKEEQNGLARRGQDIIGSAFCKMKANLAVFLLLIKSVHQSGDHGGGNAVKIS